MKAARRSKKKRSTKSVKKRDRLHLWKKSVFAISTIVGFFVILEAVLAVGGVCSSYQMEDPLVGFSTNLPLFSIRSSESDGQIVSLTKSQAKRFNPIEFIAHKPEHTCRMVCLGGSTTYGRPFFNDASFTGFLHAILPKADSTRQWELINAGAYGYASYRVARVMQELVEFEPDVFIIYTGHNEFLERRTYAHLM